MTRYKNDDLVVALGDGAGPEVFTAIGALTDAGSPQWNRDLYEVTAYGDAAKQFLAGFSEGQDWTLTVAYDPADAGHTLVGAHYDDANEHNLQITFPNGTDKVTIGGVFTGYGYNLGRGQANELTFTVKITSARVDPA